MFFSTILCKLLVCEFLGDSGAGLFGEMRPSVAPALLSGRRGGGRPLWAALVHGNWVGLTTECFESFLGPRFLPLAPWTPWAWVVPVCGASCALWGRSGTSGLDLLDASSTSP